MPPLECCRPRINWAGTVSCVNGCADDTRCRIDRYESGSGCALALWGDHLLGVYSIPASLLKQRHESAQCMAGARCGGGEKMLSLSWRPPDGFAHGRGKGEDDPLGSPTPARRIGFPTGSTCILSALSSSDYGCETLREHHHQPTVGVVNPDKEGAIASASGITTALLTGCSALRKHLSGLLDATLQNSPRRKLIRPRWRHLKHTSTGWMQGKGVISQPTVPRNFDGSPGK